MEFPCPQELDTKGARLKKNKSKGKYEWMRGSLCRFLLLVLQHRCKRTPEI